MILGKSGNVRGVRLMIFAKAGELGHVMCLT